jgi:F420-dependent oxidoreductase-like protein
MTAAGLDFVSDGRFTLGLGASGPQVIEGFHGVPYAAPLARTREVAQVCRQVWRRELVVHDGTHFQLPLTKQRGGTGLGKPLKLINTPVRARIPLVLAALGPRNVALAAELFEGWEPVFFYPEAAKATFGDAIAEGLSKRDPELGPLDVVVDTHLAIVVGKRQRDAALERVRHHLALYIGGMGAKGKNFYNDLACRYGFEAEARRVQDLFLGGDKKAAARALPEVLVEGVSLVGTRNEVRERVAAFAEAGATTLNAMPLAEEHGQQLRDVETLKELCFR